MTIIYLFSLNSDFKRKFAHYFFSLFHFNFFLYYVIIFNFDFVANTNYSFFSLTLPFSFTHFTKHIIIVLLIALGFHKSGLGRLGCKLLRCLDYFHLTYIRLFPPELNGLIERNYHLYSHFSSLKCHLFLFYKNIFDEN